MAFIEKKDPTVLNIMLTSKGRELLSTGNLTFKYYAIGDSEVDYDFNSDATAFGFNAFDSNILRAKDKNPKILSFIPRNLSGDPYNVIPSIPISSYEVVNSVSPIGFFTSGGTEFITDGDHVKQPDAMVDMGTVTGSTVLQLLKAPTYGTSGLEPEVGDLVLVKWTAGESTTGHTDKYSFNKDYPTPFLTYQITGLTGSLGADDLVVEVDRELPNLSGLTGIYAGAMIYYNYINFSGGTIFGDYSTDYLDESVLSFLQNSQCPTVVFPFWNMSIIYTDEIAGVQLADRKFQQFNSRTYGGFVSYIQNQAADIKKLGVIHYTNSSPANVYGEGLYLDTPILDIPTIMWHKSSGQTLGTTLTPIGGVQFLTGLDTKYYDLADPEGFVVGKVFIDLKIFVIEDQELLYAMSFKSNRSWTLPDYYAGTAMLPNIPECLTGNTITWIEPVNNAGGAACIVCAEYCHCTSCAWIPFTGSISVAGADNTGYRVSICNCTSITATKTDICAYDYVADSCVASTGCTDGGSGTGIYSVTLTGVTNTNPYYFKGAINYP